MRSCTVGSSSMTRIVLAPGGASVTRVSLLIRAVSCLPALDDITTAGTLMVKVDPLPGSLSTLTSPPIIWQK